MFSGNAWGCFSEKNIFFVKSPILAPFLTLLKAPDTAKILILVVLSVLSHGHPEEMAGWVLVFLGLRLPFRYISR